MTASSRFRGLCVLTTVAGALTGLWAVAQLAPETPRLSGWLPSGALVYLESEDLAAQLGDWNDSEASARWLTSTNREEFLTTRLMLKLDDVYAEFTEAAGFAPDLTAFESVAGQESALALYDIRNLYFVYVSRLPQARLTGNVLTRAAGYEARDRSGQPYFLREAGERVSAFAVVGDYLLVGTREDLLVRAIDLMLTDEDNRDSVAEEPWYQTAVAELPNAERGPVPLRMVMDLPTVIRTPYFRSYWIQDNTSAWSGYDAFLAQITREGEALEETRVFVRPESVELTSNRTAAERLLGFVPESAGLARLWDAATPEFALGLVREKLFASGGAAAAPSRVAPSMSLAAVVGTVNDLETRIDAAPLPPLAGNLDLGPLGELIAASGLQAVLHLESGVSPDEPVFISTDAAVAFESEMPWDPDAVRAALTAALRSYQTVGDLGLGWRAVAAGPVTASELDGLLPLVVYADGTTLWIARTPALLGAALSGTPGGAGPGAGTFVARYDHRAELPGYLKTTRMLDLSDPARYSSFFSQNVGSLAAALDTVRSVEVRIDDDGRVQRHIVRYSLTE